jgi:hypothetical protein
MGAAGAGAGEAGRFEDEMDKEEGRCPRRPELEFPLMFDARFMSVHNESIRPTPTSISS